MQLFQVSPYTCMYLFQFKVSSEGGLCVNEYMLTSQADVYAAGDVCTACWEWASNWQQVHCITVLLALLHVAGCVLKLYYVHCTLFGLWIRRYFIMLCVVTYRCGYGRKRAKWVPSLHNAWWHMHEGKKSHKISVLSCLPMWLASSILRSVQLVYI